MMVVCFRRFPNFKPILALNVSSDFLAEYTTQYRRNIPTRWSLNAG